MAVFQKRTKVYGVQDVSRVLQNYIMRVAFIINVDFLTWLEQLHKQQVSIQKPSWSQLVMTTVIILYLNYSKAMFPVVKAIKLQLWAYSIVIIWNAFLLNYSTAVFYSLVFELSNNPIAIIRLQARFATFSAKINIY